MPYVVEYHIQEDLLHYSFPHREWKINQMSDAHTSLLVGALVEPYDQMLRPATQVVTTYSLHQSTSILLYFANSRGNDLRCGSVVLHWILPDCGHVDPIHQRAAKVTVAIHWQLHHLQLRLPVFSLLVGLFKVYGGQCTSW